MKTAAQALALVRKQGIVTLAAHLEGVPCLVDLVAGERVRGSWWGHPKGKLIFNLARELEDSDEVLSIKLLDGKATFVHRALWPALLAVVLDPKWRASRAKALTAGARALWRKVEVQSRRGEAPAQVKALEQSLLVHCGSEHTGAGRHEKRLTAWAHWAKARRAKPAAEGSIEKAIASLREAAAGNATALE